MESGVLYFVTPGNAVGKIGVSERETGRPDNRHFNATKLLSNSKEKEPCLIIEGPHSYAKYAPDLGRLLCPKSLIISIDPSFRHFKVL